MGREVRMVPLSWEHPKDEDTGRYKPLHGSDYTTCAADFMKKANEEGLQEAVDYFGGAPDCNDYMPQWSAEEKTHFMMYETTSEGTPISPAFATPEELAQWLFDNGASSFGKQTASYEGWLRVAKGGFALSAVYTQATGVINGVDAL